MQLLKHPTRGLVLGLVAIASAVVIAVLAPAAMADQPTKAEFTNVMYGTMNAGVACPFDIQVTAVVSGTYKAFVDTSGGLKKEQYHILEQDTFQANGKSLTGVPFTFNVTWLYERGVLAHVYADGVEEKVPLPDGSLFIAAGRVDFVAHGLPAFILTPDHGGTANLDGFCAALAP